MNISEHELSQIVENSQTEVFIVDVESFRFVYANAMARANLEYTNEEILQLGPHDIAVHMAPEKIR